ncbi:RasGAP protein [Rhizoctonia solani AG-1 IA]|uniref:RasGAP protein n=1 Tax=Thanatephorus cucumeris (strain AG1-IA) TaxID=983506 RepID=L8WS10_THACA|nr:RasGAP protein [Rhizoctonia solani AG-1 IA]
MSENNVTQNDILYMEAKSIFVHLLRSMPQAQDKRSINLPAVAERAATTKDATLVRKGIKVKEMLRELEELRIVDKNDDYKLMREEVAAELVHLGNMREKVLMETRSLDAVYKTICDHNNYLRSQLEQYKAYLQNVRLTSQKDRGTTGVGVVTFGGKERRPTKATVLGPYRFTHAQLERESIIMESNVPENRRPNIYFNISSPTPGTFIIALHYKGRDKAILEMDLKIDDLLEKGSDALHLHVETALNLHTKMTFASTLLFGLVWSWLWAAEAKSSKLELVVRSRSEERLLKRGNATVEYLKYAAQSYNALTTIGEYSFLLSLDTGSADTWVVSSSCHTSECRGLPAYPDHLSSPTFASVNNNETAFRIRFADGTRATGIVASETMGVGGFNLTSQLFGERRPRTRFSKIITDRKISLGRQVDVTPLSVQDDITECPSIAVPPVARLAQQGLLSYPMFGLSLRKNDTGAIDSDVVKNQSLISWHDVAPFPTLPNDNSSIYLQWAIHLAGVAVGISSVSFCITPNQTTTDKQREPIAQLDISQHNRISAPGVAELFSHIPASRLVGDGQYAIPCDTTVGMRFTFGSRNYTLQPHDYIFARVLDPPNMCLAWPLATAPSEDGIDWQFGTPFLRTVYSIFSYGIDTKEPPKIGLYSVSPDVVVDTEESISQSLSVESATFATTLPNYVLPTPTYTTPPYLFSPTPSPTLSSSNTTPRPSETSTAPSSTFEYSVPTLGELASSGLGASTYSALLTRTTPLPSAHAPVVIVTDSNGSATTRPLPMQSVVLGGPEKNSAIRIRTLGSGLGPLLFGLYIVLLF